MTIEERMTKIDNAAGVKEKEKREKEEKEIKEIDDLIDQCNQYSERVRNLLILARYCVSKGIKIPIKPQCSVTGYNSAEKYGYPHEFYAEGICRHVGFMTRESRYVNKPKIIAIGIENGGACGVWDFYYTEDDIYSQHEGNKLSTKRPRKEDMKQFLEEFELFEKAFYNFVDSL